MIRVVIADDQPLVLRGINDLLRSARNVEVVAACVDGKQALHTIRTLKPDVAVLDLSMPEMTGLEVLAAVTADGPATRIVLLAAPIEAAYITTMINESVYGVFFKDAPPDDLIRCVHDVAAGLRCIPPNLLRSVRQQRDGSAAASINRSLTPCEQKVMRFAAKGLSNKEIGRQLNVTEGTAKVHLHHIYRKLGINNRTALAGIAIRSARRQRNKTG